MKNVKVIRSAGRTVVIYSDAKVSTKKRSVVAMTQKPIRVRFMGKTQYYIMPNGKMYTPRRSIIQVIRDIMEYPITNPRIASLA